MAIFETIKTAGSVDIIEQNENYCGKTRGKLRIDRVRSSFVTRNMRWDAVRGRYERWVAFPHPQVIFQFFDAFTGEMRYSETIVKGL